MNKIVKSALIKVLGALSDVKCEKLGLSKLEMEELRKFYESLMIEEEKKIDYIG